MYEMSIFLLLIFAATICSILLMLYAITQHAADKSLFLIFLSVCTFVYSFGYLLEITSPTIEAAFQSVRIQYMGLPFVLPISYLFVRDIYGKDRFNSLKLFLIFITPILSVLAMQAYPLLKIYYANIEYIHNGAIAICRVHPGPLYHLYTAYCYLLFLLILKIVIQQLIKSGGSQYKRRQGRILLIAYLTPMLSSIPYIFSSDAMRYDLTPIANTLSMALLLYAMRYHNLISVVPLARAHVIESMEDAFIVCDKNFNFLDANAIAKRLFPILDALVPGDTIDGWEAFKGLTEFSVVIGGETRFFKATQTNIQQDSTISGMCFVLHDTTENEKLLKKLRVQAAFDPLMDIYNRGTFFELAQAMFQDSASRNHSYALLMIDIDYFKHVNDSYGHPSGDFVLKTVSDTIKEAFRQDDLIGRYGGEEIVVLLEKISTERAFSAAEELRTTIERTPVVYHDHIIPITISIGIAFSSAGTVHSLETMLSQADTAMYNAKDNGRNQTIAG